MRYFDDPYLEHLCGFDRSSEADERGKKGAGRRNRNKKIRRTALINKGYALRVAVIRSLVDRFISHCDAAGQEGQVLSLGAGFDSGYFYVTSNNMRGKANAVRWVDVDLPEVAKRKRDAILSSCSLWTMLDDIDRTDSGLRSKGYGLVGVDMRLLGTLHSPRLTELAEAAPLKRESPTLIVAECVFQYLDPEDCVRIIQHVAEEFPNAVMATYDQIASRYDMFSIRMIASLNLRGAPLKGLARFSTPRSLLARLVQNGFDKARISALVRDTAEHMGVGVPNTSQEDIFDEYEEYDRHCQHYCITVAANSIGLGKIFEQLLPFENGKNWIASPSPVSEEPPITRHPRLGRWGAAYCADPRNNIVLMVGGFDAITGTRSGNWMKLDLRNGTINQFLASEQQNRSRYQLPRVGAALTWFGDDNTSGPGPILWGGRTSPTKLSDSLPLILDIASNVWRPLPATDPEAQKPKARHRHAFAYIGSFQHSNRRDFIGLTIGGIDANGSLIEGVQALICSRNLSTSELSYGLHSVAINGEKPPPVFSAILTTVHPKAQKELVVEESFPSGNLIGSCVLTGGRDTTSLSSSPKSTTDCYLLSLYSREGSLNKDDVPFVLSSKKIPGIPGGSRYSHAAFWIKAGDGSFQLAVSGGVKHSASQFPPMEPCLLDCLNVSKLTWKSILVDRHETSTGDHKPSGFEPLRHFLCAVPHPAIILGTLRGKFDSCEILKLRNHTLIASVGGGLAVLALGVTSTHL
eukprot:CAMPEP_0114493776 /NCGR_PEP_ID=MMETSP0109-20121206/4290_1 /TAXON_ID=29199 /ORGANISM="Chlorarachnion reptans, Strain CCCM449" /LENGTH=747 /DNA_ID=CAMNT_0001670751 /DNA_START=1847 /DNA_END=4091 /DNA_ORIENTATION=-